MALFARWTAIGLVAGLGAGALYGLDYALVGAALGIIGGLSAAAILRSRRN
ncbi:MAG: hypothetical protein WDZ83_04780 [Rhizobiaceae bacterium]